MMNEKELKGSVEKYIKSECTPEEKALLEKYLDSFQGEEDHWINGDIKEKKLIEEKIYSSVLENIQLKELNIFRKAFHKKYLFRVAASVVFIMLLSYGVIRFSNVFNHKQEIVWIEKTTVFGEKALFSFPDGTNITLNAESRLRYPDRFGEGERIVYLEGEAYFDVSHDSNKAFIVHSGNLTTTVLGTIFNIKAFPNEKEILISLIDGNIKVVKAEEGVPKDLLLLRPSQQLVYSRSEDISLVQTFDIQEVTGWKGKTLKVTDEPLENVLVKLERFFGKEFVLLNKEFAKLKITANFKKNSFRTGILVLKKLTGLKYKMESENGNVKKVIFY
jgi:transmembrane sensor